MSVFSNDHCVQSITFYWRIIQNSPAAASELSALNSASQRLKTEAISYFIRFFLFMFI